MKIIKNKVIIVLIFVLTIFFFLYSFLTITSPKKFTSPDENINLFYIDLYSSTGRLYYYEPLSTITQGFARPRNTASVKGKIVPSTFAGFYILYGTIGAISSSIIFFLNPSIGLLGSLFIYILSKVLFDTKTALLSTILTLLLIPYWYWSSMSLYNNLPATVFFVGGVTFTFLAIKSKKLGYYFVTALFYGIGHFMRLTDITYFIPLMYLFIVYRKSINFKYVSFSFVIYLLTVIPQLIVNFDLYGSPLSFGYTNGVKLSDTNTSLPLKIYHQVSFFLAPSGIRVDKILYSSLTYIIMLIPIFFLLGIIGLVYNIKSKSDLTRNYTKFYILLSLWILVYYGSGIFWGLDRFTLDASYIRYFLPIYILIIPLITSLMVNLPKNLVTFVLCVIVTVSVSNINTLYSGFNDIKDRRIDSAKESDRIFSSTEKNSILITTLSDKYLFPQRKIIAYGPVLNDFISNKPIFTYKVLVEIINNLEENKQVTYLLNDRNDLDINKINSMLSMNHLIAKKSSKIDYLYKIVTLKT